MMARVMFRVWPVVSFCLYASTSVQAVRDDDMQDDDMQVFVDAHSMQSKEVQRASSMMRGEGSFEQDTGHLYDKEIHIQTAGDDGCDRNGLRLSVKGEYKMGAETGLSSSWGDESRWKFRKPATIGISGAVDGVVVIENVGSPHYKNLEGNTMWSVPANKTKLLWKVKWHGNTFSLYNKFYEKFLGYQGLVENSGTSMSSTELFWYPKRHIVFEDWVDQVFYIIPVGRPGLRLSVEGASTNMNAKAILSSSMGNESKWIFRDPADYPNMGDGISLSNGHVVIENVNSPHYKNLLGDKMWSIPAKKTSLLWKVSVHHSGKFSLSRVENGKFLAPTSTEGDSVSVAASKDEPAYWRIARP